MDWQKERFSKKQLTSESSSTMTTNLPWKASLPFAVFFSQRQTEERWKRLLDRHSVRFPKYSVRNLQYEPKTRLIRGTYLKRGNTPEKNSNIAPFFFFFPPVRITSPTLATYPKPVREITILKLRLKVSRASLVYLRQGNLTTKQYTKWKSHVVESRMFTTKMEEWNAHRIQAL